MFSVVVPVYNRPQEMQELLQSLLEQSYKDFEVIVMEAPSTNSCEQICQQYQRQGLNITFHIDDSSRSSRRNKGIEIAKGEFIVLFDSDCIIPPQYFSLLHNALTAQPEIDCFGGPDAANNDFSVLQKAVNYSMTSLLTTGGIRGAMKNVDKYLPRAFNMGFRKSVYQQVGGYREMIGEDTDLSMRIKEAGFTVRLIKETFVYHKRRITLQSFARQVTTFGKARVLLSKLHPHSLKPTHLYPSAFLIGNICIVLLSIVHSPAWLCLPALYIVLMFCESLYRNRNLQVALLSPVTAYIQLCGYGYGFIHETLTKRASNQAAEQLYRQ